MILLKSQAPLSSNFLMSYPFIAGFGVAILSVGLGGLRQVWRELTILFFAGVPKVIIWPLFDISEITAQLGKSILWYSGFDVVRKGTIIALGQGAVNVNMGCSGFEGMFHLLGLAVMFLLVFPISGPIKFIVPPMAMAIAFVVNGFRVALMALLAGAGNREGLDYWHVGDGSLIFSLISVCILGLFYLFLLKKDMAEPVPVEFEPYHDIDFGEISND